MIDYSSILQTGIQSLLAVACGWGCGRWGALQPDPTVTQVNTLVLKFCIPCLQIWLLAIKTDMRQPGSWSALLAFLVWSMGLQALLALMQLIRHGRLQYAQLGVDSLLLTTNNTGILGPVVLLAALGPDYAPLGMLATVALYFQQLPSAQVLFHLHKEQVAAAAAAAAAAGSIPALPGHERQQRCGWQEQQPLLAAAEAGCISSSLCSGADSNSSSSSGAYSSRGGNTAVARQAVEGYVNGSQHALVKPAAASMSELTAADTAAAAAEGRELGFTRQQQHLQRHCGSAESLQQLHHRHTQHEYVLHVASTLKQQQHHQEHSCSFNQEHQSTASLITSLCLKNPLVWSTGIALLLSCLGSSVVLDPSSPLVLQQLLFVDGLLGWFAATTAPLTLFTTGLWMYSNSIQQQQQQQQGLQAQLKRQAPAAQQHQLVELRGYSPQQPQQQLTWRQLCLYLLARATVAPGFMVSICWLLGLKGDLAHALVILALLPVAQTAFVVCKQAEIGTHAVSVLMVASLLLMLPQLIVLLALLEWLGVFN